MYIPPFLYIISQMEVGTLPYHLGTMNIGLGQWEGGSPGHGYNVVKLYSNYICHMVLYSIVSILYYYFFDRNTIFSHRV